MAQKGLDAGDTRFLELIRKAMAASLRNHNDGLVRRRAGNGQDVRWQIGASRRDDGASIAAGPHCIDSQSDRS